MTRSSTLTNVSVNHTLLQSNILILEGNLFIGLGARDPNRDNRIVPVATFAAQPGLEYVIYPKSIYYIATGTYSEGAIVDFKGMGKMLQIDFGKSNLHDVSFTQEPSGDYVPDDANSKKLGTMMTH